MPDYLVTWTIDITADSPEEAARLALAIQRDPDSIATVFHIRVDDADADIVVDLTEIDELKEKQT